MSKCGVILIALGAILFGLSIAGGWFIVPNLIKSKINDKVKLVNGSETWEKWSNITTPIFMRIYVFHTTNPEEVKEGEKPVLEEFGPYVYEEKRVKLDIEVHEERDTVSYRQPVHFFFRSDLSNGTEEDTVTVLNMPLALLALKGAEQGFFAQMIIDSIISDHKEEKLFSVTTVGELLYKGRYVPMMKTLDENVGQAPLTNYTFGVFYPKNGSDDGRFEVKTGVKESDQFGRVVSWNGKTKLDFWDGETCNMINGSDGSLFPPFVERDRVIDLFGAGLCRSIRLAYEEDVEVRGIAGYKFVLPREAFESAEENENNACFCKDAASDRINCLKSGTVQISACRKGAPLVMSTPHFFNGDEEYIRQSIGLNPQKEKHQSWVEVEPNTGLVLRAYKRIQVNVAIKQNTVAEDFVNVPNMIYPILWADEVGEISEKTAEDVKKMLLRPMKIVSVGKWVMLGISLVFLAAGTILRVCQKQKPSLNKRVPDKGTTEESSKIVTGKNGKELQTLNGF